MNDKETILAIMSIIYDINDMHRQGITDINIHLDYYGTDSFTIYIYKLDERYGRWTSYDDQKPAILISLNEMLESIKKESELKSKEVARIRQAVLAGFDTSVLKRDEFIQTLKSCIKNMEDNE